MIEITISDCGLWCLIRIAEDGESVSVIVRRPQRHAPSRSSATAWPSPVTATPKRSPTGTAPEESWNDLLRKFSGGR